MSFNYPLDPPPVFHFNGQFVQPAHATLCLDIDPVAPFQVKIAIQRAVQLNVFKAFLEKIETAENLQVAAYSPGSELQLTFAADQELLKQLKASKQKIQPELFLSEKFLSGRAHPVLDLNAYRFMALAAVPR